MYVQPFQFPNTKLNRSRVDKKTIQNYCLLFVLKKKHKKTQNNTLFVCVCVCAILMSLLTRLSVKVSKFFGFTDSCSLLIFTSGMFRKKENKSSDKVKKIKGSFFGYLSGADAKIFPAKAFCWFQQFAEKCSRFAFEKQI